MRHLLSALLALGLAVSAAPASALEPVPAPVVIVIDIHEVVQKSAAATSIRKQLESTQKSFADELAKRERELRAAEQELAQQRSVLSAEAFQQRRRDFEAKLQDAQRDAGAKRRQFEQAVDENFNKIREQLLPIVDDLVKETKAQMVISKAAVVMVDKRWEFTDEALVRLNKKLPSLKMTMPALATAPVPAPTPAPGAAPPAAKPRQ
jgi:Skp family chaperone for outer membrane proteins